MDVMVQQVGGLRAAGIWSITRRFQLPPYPYAPFKPRCSNSKDNSRNGNNDEKGCFRSWSQQSYFNGASKYDFVVEKANGSIDSTKTKRWNVCSTLDPNLLVAFVILQGDRLSTDWDKAWSSFRKQGKKPPFSQFTPNKYVSWNPRRTEYPLSEEIDPIKRTERSNLVLWTSPKFTLVGAIVVVSMLLLYTLLSPLK